MPSTGRSLPAHFCLGGVSPSGPVAGPSSCPASLGTRAFSPPGHLLLLLFSVVCPFAPQCYPAACLPCALRPQLVLWGFFFGLPPPFPAVHPALWFPPPCMHARQQCTGHLVLAPLGALLLSHRPLAAWPSAVPCPARWVSLPRVTPLSSLFSLLSLLSLARPLTVPLLLRVLSAGLPRARAVCRARSRASSPVPCPPTCRPTLARSPDTPSVGLLRRLPPPAAPPSVP